MLAGEPERVASLTRFPFQTRGSLDDSAVETHDRATFLQYLDRWLEQDSGLGSEPQTMRDLVERTRSVTSMPADEGQETARVGSFVFQRSGGTWWFTLAYVED